MITGSFKKIWLTFEIDFVKINFLSLVFYFI